MKPSAPSTVWATAGVAAPCHTSASAETRCTWSGMSAVLLLDLRPLRLDVRDAADVEERLLGDVVVVALDDRVERLDGLLDRDRGALDAGEQLDDRVERLDGLLDRDRGALDAGELLRHVGVLREEVLDA